MPLQENMCVFNSITTTLILVPSLRLGRLTETLAPDLACPEAEPLSGIPSETLGMRGLWDEGKPQNNSASYIIDSFHTARVNPGV